MRTAILWFLGSVAIIYAVLVIYALHCRRDVKAWLKIPFAVFSFEAKEPGGDKTLSKRSP